MNFTSKPLWNQAAHKSIKTVSIQKPKRQEIWSIRPRCLLPLWMQMIQSSSELFHAAILFLRVQCCPLSPKGCLPPLRFPPGQLLLSPQNSVQRSPPLGSSSGSISPLLSHLLSVTLPRYLVSSTPHVIVTTLHTIRNGGMVQLSIQSR